MHKNQFCKRGFSRLEADGFATQKTKIYQNTSEMQDPKTKDTSKEQIISPKRQILHMASITYLSKSPRSLAHRRRNYQPRNTTQNVIPKRGLATSTRNLHDDSFVFHLQAKISGTQMQRDGGSKEDLRQVGISRSSESGASPGPATSSNFRPWLAGWLAGRLWQGASGGERHQTPSSFIGFLDCSNR